MTSTETAATNRYTLLRSMPSGDTYAGIISRDGQLIGITPDLDHEDVQAALEDPGILAMWDYDEPTEGQIEMWERDGWETGPRLVELETRTTVYETHPDGSPALSCKSTPQP